MATMVYLAAFQLFAFWSSLWKPCVNVGLTVSLKGLWLQWISMLCWALMKLVNIINIILTPLVCQSFPSYFVVMCLFVLILNLKRPKMMFLPDQSPALMIFSLAAAREHRRHHLQLTAHIAQVSITVILFHFMTPFLFETQLLAP